MKKRYVIFTFIFLLFAVADYYVCKYQISEIPAARNTELNNARTEISAKKINDNYEKKWEYECLSRHEQPNLIIYALMIICLSLYERKKQNSYNVTQLLNLSHNKLHNIRNNYTVLLGLLDEQRYSLAHEYVESSAAYFSKTLSNHSDKNWTLENELDLLERYYNAEKIIYFDVEIITQISVEDIDRILFTPDLLTVFLQNSMEHAFKNKPNNRVFKINIKKEQKALCFEISDNGNGKDDYFDYFPTDRRHSGLNVAVWRIANEWLRNRMTILDNYWLGEHFRIPKHSKENGTTFQFEYPYETTAKDINS